VSTTLYRKESTVVKRRTFICTLAILSCPSLALALASSPWSIGLSSTVGLRPVFYHYDGRYFESRITADYQVSPDLLFTAQQGFRATEQLQFTNRELYGPSDSQLRLTAPRLFQYKRFNLTGRVQTVLPQSELSVRDGLTTNVAGRLILSHDWGRAGLQAFYLIEGRENFFKYTRQVTDHANLQREFIHGGGLSYALTKTLTMSSSLSLFQGLPYEGEGRPLDFYFTTFETAWAPTPLLNFAAGLETFEGQFKNGKRVLMTMYREDRSEIYLRAGFTL
jgi:hypothetical protein